MVWNSLVVVDQSQEGVPQMRFWLKGVMLWPISFPSYQVFHAFSSSVESMSENLINFILNFSLQHSQVFQLCPLVHLVMIVPGEVFDVDDRMHLQLGG